MLQTNIEEIIKTHFIFNGVFENPVVHKIVWKNTVESDRPQMKIGCMCIPYGIPKATITH